MTNLTKALLKVQAEVGAIAKDSKNPFFKSTYLSLNGLREAVLPVLTKNGIVLLQPTVFREGRNFVATQLIHADTGETIEGLTEIAVKNVGNAQEYGSGVSYSRRYGLMSILSLAAEDDDGESAVARTPKATVVVKPATVEAKPESEEPPKKVSSFNRNFAKKDTTTVKSSEGDI